MSKFSRYIIFTSKTLQSSRYCHHAVCMYVYVCMCMYVNSRRFFLGAPAAFYIGTGHPMGNISRRFFRIFEIFIFGRFIAKKGSKLTAKRTFSLNPTAFFSGKGHILFVGQNMFIGGILRGMRSMVPKFAFLVLEIGLRNPPNLRIF